MHSVVKLMKTKEEKKAARKQTKKRHITYRETVIKMTTQCSTEETEVKIQNTNYKVFK